MNTGFLDPAVATVPTACGIETSLSDFASTSSALISVATVPTACGIETCNIRVMAIYYLRCNSTYRLRY